MCTFLVQFAPTFCIQIYTENKGSTEVSEGFDMTLMRCELHSMNPSLSSYVNVLHREAEKDRHLFLRLPIHVHRAVWGCILTRVVSRQLL